MSPKRAMAILVSAAALVLVGCAQPQSKAREPLPTNLSTSADPAPLTPLPGLTWNSSRTNTIAQGWTAGPCPGGGDSPLRCLSHSGHLAAQMEFLKFSKKSLDAGAEPANALVHRIAHDSYATFKQDRLHKCGTNSVVDPFATQSTVVFGSPGLRYEFRLHRDGHVDEMVVGWIQAHHRNTVEMVVTAAYGRHPCLPPEGPRVSPSRLATASSVLDAAMAAALPA